MSTIQKYQGVQRVTVTETVDSRSLNEILLHSQCTSLNLKNYAGQNFLALSSEYKNLQELTVSGTDLVSLEGIDKFPNLKSVKIKGGNLVLLSDSLAKLVRLEKLDISGNKVSDLSVLENLCVNQLKTLFVDTPESRDVMSDLKHSEDPEYVIKSSLIKHLKTFGVLDKKQRELFTKSHDVKSILRYIEHWYNAYIFPIHNHAHEAQINKKPPMQFPEIIQTLFGDSEPPFVVYHMFRSLDTSLHMKLYLHCRDIVTQVRSTIHSFTEMKALQAESKKNAILGQCYNYIVSTLGLTNDDIGNVFALLYSLVKSMKAQRAETDQKTIQKKGSKVASAASAASKSSDDTMTPVEKITFIIYNIEVLEDFFHPEVEYRDYKFTVDESVFSPEMLFRELVFEIRGSTCEKYNFAEYSANQVRNEFEANLKEEAVKVKFDSKDDHQRDGHRRTHDDDDEEEIPTTRRHRPRHHSDDDDEEQLIASACDVPSTEDDVPPTEGDVPPTKKSPSVDKTIMRLDPHKQIRSLSMLNMENNCVTDTSFMRYSSIAALNMDGNNIDDYSGVYNLHNLVNWKTNDMCFGKDRANEFFTKFMDTKNHIDMTHGIYRAVTLTRLVLLMQMMYSLAEQYNEDGQQPTDQSPLSKFLVPL
jgi:Leucine-rich repeat (LRR) protein